MSGYTLFTRGKTEVSLVSRKGFLQNPFHWEGSSMFNSSHEEHPSHKFDRKHLILTYRGHTRTVSTVTWSPRGDRLASSSWDKTAQVWEASSGERLLTYERHREGIDTLAWSPNGLYLASGGDDQTIDIWDAQSGRTLQTYHGHTSVVRAVSWSPDGLFIASGGSDDTVQIWRAHTGEHLLTYQGHPAKSRGVFVVAWSPSDMVVASGGKEKTIHLWDGRDGRPISFYQGHSSKVFSLAWSPNGKLIASGDETSIHVWEVATGKRICLYQAHHHPCYGIRSLAWSPDGAFLVSGSDDCTGKHGNQTVHVWNARTGEPLFIYDGHEERTEVRSVSWSPDGTRIASGGGDDTVQIWSVPPLDLMFSSGEGRNE
jgi:WD40 repeat protein